MTTIMMIGDKGNYVVFCMATIMMIGDMSIEQ
jgi:hypothetical protein